MVVMIFHVGNRVGFWTRSPSWWRRISFVPICSASEWHSCQPGPCSINLLPIANRRAAHFGIITVFDNHLVVTKCPFKPPFAVILISVNDISIQLIIVCSANNYRLDITRFSKRSFCSCDSGCG